VVTARCGVLADGPVVASRWQGVVGELVGPTRRARAMRAEAEPTEGSGRLRGRVVAQCGGARWDPHWREGRRLLRLAPGATGEDERGEGGPK
jgi:hypothetical protein